MEDLLEELGALALGSRLKRLADALMQDGVRVYQSAEAGFEPRWFPVFMFLYRQGPTSITELARGLGVSHPGINKIANELIDAKLVAPYRDRNDKRKRVLALTSHGRTRQKELEVLWRDIRQSLQSAVDDGGGDFLGALTRLEKSLDRQSFYQRYEDQQARHTGPIEILPFEPRFAEDFRELNENWIRRYFTLEPADSRVLDDPEGTLIDAGGDVVFAIDRTSGAVIGTCALIRLSDKQAELAKMAVDDKAKGKQVGYLLGCAIIEQAREKKFEVLCLESNRKLTPAISLYRRLGFEERPFPHASDYSRADIYMELVL
jgi:DNA-binding MarR family transcriptional regulator/GNAT superfamily N-acetyltransferase